MASKEFIFDLSQIDLNHVSADIDEIRKYNPQRYEMEQLTAIIYEDNVQNVCVGYKDITLDDFWVRGHMPNMPLLPGVIMLETAAQMCSYFTQKYDLLGVKMVGFGGLEKVRFRGVVIPGDRLHVICMLTKVRKGQIIVCRFQGFVKDSIVLDGILKGIPIPVDMLAAQQAEKA